MSEFISFMEKADILAGLYDTQGDPADLMT